MIRWLMCNLFAKTGICILLDSHVGFENCHTGLGMMWRLSGLANRLFLVWRLGLGPQVRVKGAVMASISEIERAKMVTSLAGAIGKEEANVLATALNLDGQLATRDELRVMEMAIRSDMQDIKDELKDHFRSELKSEIGSLRTELKSEIGSLRTELKSEIGSLRTELKSEIGALRDDMKAENGSLRSEIGALRDDMTAENGSLRSEIGALRTEFTTEVRKQTRQLFVALITVVATIFGLMAGLLGITGKL